MRIGQIFFWLGNEAVEIGDDGAEHAEPPEVLLTGYRSWNPSHQQESSNVRWQCPGVDVAFGFIIEQLFAANSCSKILLEAGGEVAAADI